MIAYTLEFVYVPKLECNRTQHRRKLRGPQSLPRNTLWDGSPNRPILFGADKLPPLYWWPLF